MQVTHSWTPANQCVLAGWRYAFTGVSKINAIIFQVDQSSLSDESKNKVVQLYASFQQMNDNCGMTKTQYKNTK